MSNDLRIDHQEARTALAGAARRTAALLASIDDPSRPVPKSTWTVGEVGAHLAVALQGFTEAVGGRYETLGPHIRPGTFAHRLSGVTAGTLAVETERDPQKLAAIVLDRVDAFLAATAGLSGHERVATPWYGEGASLGVATATTMLTGEQLLHGRDLAVTVGEQWPISPPDARLIVKAITSMLPLVANPAATAGLRATYAVGVRGGGPEFVVRVEGGAVTVEPAGSTSVDCHISADPVTFVLVGYGRIGQWGPIATGRMRAWGRKPWLAFRFVNLFFNP